MNWMPNRAAFAGSPVQRLTALNPWTLTPLIGVLMQKKSDAGALAGIRVLDFGQYLSAPMVAMFLADNGADVIHVDPPKGPAWDHPANAALHRSKRSVRLDLHSAQGLAKARQLVGGADIVLENFRPGVMTRLGLDPQALCAAHPRLIWCAIPGFAQDDPRASMQAWEGIVCAATGLYPRHGFAPDKPMFTALPLASNFGAFVAAHRVAAALLLRLQSGQGQYIEASLFEACFQALGMHAELPNSRDLSNTLLSRVRPVLRMRRAADGTYLYFDSPLRGLQAFLDRFLPGRDLLTMDATALAQTADRLDEVILQKPGAEWERICQEEIKGAFGLVQTLPAWLADAHALASETIVQVEDGVLGTTRQPGYPVLLSKTRPSVRWGRGTQDPVDPLAIDWLEQRLVDTPTRSATELPLAGLRVLDCSTLLAGPTSARILAQYGAQVTKIDRAGIASGDVDPLSDDEFAFIGARTVSAGKRMVFLDLKHAPGQQILGALVQRADVVHHNFTPSAATRLGLGAEQLQAQHPALILSTMSLHSHGGFRAEYRGHDMLGQMITGMGHRAGGSGTPQVAATVLNDNAAGHLHAFGILVALIHRARGGGGQEVNSALSRTATLHQLPFMVGFEGRVWDEPAGPEAAGWNALDRLYASADGWFYLAVGPDCAAARARLHADPLFAQAPAGWGEELAQFLQGAFARQSTEACLQALQVCGLSAHRYVTLPELARDAYVLSRRYLAVDDHPGIGRAMGVGQLLYGAPASPARMLQARKPGMDTATVLEEIGFGDQLADLLAQKTVALDHATLLNTPLAPDFWERAQKMAPSALTGLRIEPDIVARIQAAAPAQEAR